MFIALFVYADHHITGETLINLNPAALGKSTF